MTERAFVIVPLADLAPEWAGSLPADAASVRPAGLPLRLPE
jgi:7,8-dihydro-6-hydroxymethylpterin-pyrophosphokinase